MGATWSHRLSNKDTSTQTATCAKCGPVSIKYKSGSWRCTIGVREQKGPHYNVGGHGLTGAAAKRFKEGKSCVICGATEDLAVDHCHATGVIRGVLCRPCNLGLGYFRDNPQRLLGAVEYLAEFAKGHQD